MCTPFGVGFIELVIKVKNSDHEGGSIPCALYAMCPGISTHIKREYFAVSSRLSDVLCVMKEPAIQVLRIELSIRSCKKMEE